jgi:hypothetical protein
LQSKYWTNGGTTLEGSGYDVGMILPLWAGWFITSSEMWMWIWVGVATILEIVLAYYGITPRVVKLKTRRRTFLVNGLVFYALLNVVIDFSAMVILLG